MAESVALQGVPGTVRGSGSGAYLPLSSLRALPYFFPVGIFPFIAAAALYGGWWLAGPFLFTFLVDQLDTALGKHEENIAPQQRERDLFWFKMAVWFWVALYPVTFIYAFRQVFVADYLGWWEDVLIVLSLGVMARLALNAGHDMMHRRTTWERRVGELLMASVSFPQEITEHVCIHHTHIGTPLDAVSAPRGQSFWQYLPRSVARSYADTWRFERERLARRRLPVWHYTNPVWRYVLETAAWYALAYGLGGVAGALVFLAISAMGIFQLRMVDYLQHYGLQRVHLPNGRFERVQPRHSWSIAYKLSDWFYYNAQRHADHHISATRLYPLLQHCGPDTAPQLPGSYSELSGIVLFPQRWFKTMDPLVEQWRAHFYPHIDDWRAYDSAAYQACPDAFKVIDEIQRAAPPLAAWIDRDPGLLAALQRREFTDLDLPDGFGPDPEFETLARRGLARVYWTLECNVAEMRAQLDDTPMRNVREAVETVRDWSNDKVFQLCLHVLRGNLTPTEAGLAVSNIAEASLSTVLAAVSADCNRRRLDGGLVAAMLGDPASGDALFGTDLDVMLLYEGAPHRHLDKLFRRCLKALDALAQDNLLFARHLRHREPAVVTAPADFRDAMLAQNRNGKLPDMTRLRRVFADDAETGERFDQTRLDLLNATIATTATQVVADLETLAG
ncbi:MAG: fatty acid desaturase [Gammaproteobacteria bacterium]|nr:fatty acid desaturase [Gammaproteobacteria bacterium]